VREVTDYILSHFEEVVGVLHDLDEENSSATIHRLNVHLPQDLINLLKPYVGRPVGVIRTDDQAKPYRWRLLD
jgi:mRNA deadenylase 3'-5' endonuclease subunit Ccr4